MWLERLRRYILPGSVERDPGFRKEIERLGHIGLQVVGGVEIVVSTFMAMAYILLQPDPELLTLRLTLTGVLVTVGLLTLALSRVDRARRYARRLAAASGLSVAAILVWFLLLMTTYDPTADDMIPGQITLVTLVAVAAIPLRPTDTMLFGFLLESLYVVLAIAAQEFHNVGAGVDALYFHAVVPGDGIDRCRLRSTKIDLRMAP
jgi:hypothetical protein